MKRWGTQSGRNRELIGLSRPCKRDPGCEPFQDGRASNDDWGFGQDGTLDLAAEARHCTFVACEKEEEREKRATAPPTVCFPTARPGGRHAGTELATAQNSFNRR